jgi:hypothetical protein
MGYWFEFDSVNKILLLRVEGRLTNELLEEMYQAGHEYWAATDPNMGIWDFSSVTEVALSTKFLRQLAYQDPVGGTLPRVIVAPNPLLFGLARMFQIIGERTRPLLQVVHTRAEAFSALGVQSPHFTLLE